MELTVLCVSVTGQKSPGCPHLCQMVPQAQPSNPDARSKPEICALGRESSCSHSFERIKRFFWQRKKDNFEKMIASKLSSVNETLYYFLPSTAGKKYFLPLNVHRSCPQIYKKPEYQTLKSVYANNTKIGQKTCSIKGTKTICIFGSHSITIFFLPKQRGK